MKQTKNVSMTSIEKLLDYVPGTVVLQIGEADGVQVIVKKRLSFEERQRFVSTVCDMAFAADENGDVDYYAHLKRFARAYGIITYFTNIKMPDDIADNARQIERLWAFFDSTDIVSRIIEAVGEDYVGELFRLADEMIEYKKASMLNKSKFDKIFDSLANAFNMVGANIEELGVGGVLKLLGEDSPELKNEFIKLMKEQAEEAAK